MGDARRKWGAAWAILGGAAAAAVLASPATADREDLRLLAHPSVPSQDSSLGVGGDGSVVFYVSETPGGSEGTGSDGDPVLLAWNTRQDLVGGVGSVEAALVGQLSVDTRTVGVFSDGPDRASPVSLFAVAVGGLVVTSDDPTFADTTQLLAPTAPFTVESPSVVLKARVTLGRVAGRHGEVPVAAEVRDVSVAYAADLTGVPDNGDANREIFLWSRSEFLGSQASGGDFEDIVPRQITHTVADEDDVAEGREIACSSPALSRRGEVAFVSNADITGGNPDKSQEVFVWWKGSTRQITSVERGTFAGLRWSPDGRVLVFESTGDPVRRNPDESSEIFLWNRRRLVQLTAGTTGGSFAPSADNGGRVAFLSTADLPGLSIPTDAPEVVVATHGGRRLRQVTVTPDGDPDGDPPVENETPVVSTEWDGSVVVTFVSSSDVDGRNSTHARRIWRAVVFRNPVR